MITGEQIKFAEEMAELLYSMRGEDLFASNLYTKTGFAVPEEFVDKIVDDEDHTKIMKEIIKKDILQHFEQNPNSFRNAHDDGYEYTVDVYDFAYVLDSYVEEQYEKLRISRLKKTYKIVSKVYLIETDSETGHVDQHEKETVEIKTVDSLVEVASVQNKIRTLFKD